MKRVISLLLAALMLFALILPLTACDEEATDSGESSGNNANDEIVTPDFLGNDRGTVKFDDIVYSRPNTEQLISGFESIADAIEKNETEYETQKAEIIRIDEEYIEFSTMLSFANIQLQRDTSNEYWAEEYEYLSSALPTLSKAVEELLVAAARSPHAILFEKECFGEGLIEDYADGGIYTDTLVALLNEETELENRYSTLSTATVTISYMGKTGTVDEIISHISERYGNGTSRYKSAVAECMEIYEEQLKKINIDLLVDLFKIRRKISDELGYETYATYAYESLSHDYSPEDSIEYVLDIAKYVSPVYMKIMNFTTLPDVGAVTKNEVMNDLYYAYTAMDKELGDIYSYMLQYNLYDCAPSEENRFDGAFTTYLDYYDAPYLFATLESSPADYTTISHEFGHFYDAYVNFDSQTSLDLSETSSSALEFLSIIALAREGRISDAEYKYLTYSGIETAMRALILQGFFTLFEHYAYELEYEEISEDALSSKMFQASLAMGLNPAIFPTLDTLAIPQVMLYPFYVQSYCTSGAVALEIYYLESESEGAGLEAYKKLVSRGDSELTFEEHLKAAGLHSPFEKDYMLTLANKIHYSAFSKNYFSQPTTDSEKNKA